MNALVESHRDALVQLCNKYCVSRLELFGSGTTREFNPQTSDLDFLVEFGPIEGMTRADAYFNLLSDLEKLFNRHVDLVEEGAIRNPYFRRGVDQTRELLYAA